MPKVKNLDIKLLAKNKKAYSDFEVLEKIEAGLVLVGSEVKSVKDGHAQLRGSFIEVHHGNAYVKNVHISKYKFDAKADYDPLRRRKLLLHAEQINKIGMQLDTKGVAVIPLELHEKHGLVKLIIGVCRGKKKYDKREDLKKKAQNLDAAQALKRFNR